jgi:ABC-type nitrate/sulfonate/bicarbonate transport system permease component
VSTATSDESPARRAPAGLTGLGVRWAVFAGAVVVWQFAVRLVPQEKRAFFPPPVTIARRMGELWLTGPADHLFLTSRATGDIGPSLARTLGGWSIAVLAGVPAGLLLGRSQWARDYADPLIHFMRTLPPPALAPIFVILFKLTEQMRIAVIVFGVVWPIVLNAVEGARSVDPTQMETARVFHLGRPARLRWIILPAALPKIFAGLRISISIALILMVISETFGGATGIGYALFSAKDSFQVTDMWAYTVLLGILGYGLNGILLRLEQHLLAPHQGRRDAG